MIKARGPGHLLQDCVLYMTVMLHPRNLYMVAYTKSEKGKRQMSSQHGWWNSPKIPHLDEELQIVNKY